MGPGLPRHVSIQDSLSSILHPNDFNIEEGNFIVWDQHGIGNITNTCLPMERTRITCDIGTIPFGGNVQAYINIKTNG